MNISRDEALHRVSDIIQRSGVENSKGLVQALEKLIPAFVIPTLAEDAGRMEKLAFIEKTVEEVKRGMSLVKNSYEQLGLPYNAGVLFLEQEPSTTQSWDNSNCEWDDSGCSDY